ncbi:FAD-binding oxidoreductase, partial [Turicimonas muris]
AVPATDLIIEAKNARRTKKSANQFDVKIVKIVKVSDEILSMTIERVDGQKFDFEAGQVINILLPNGDSRSYSFASPAVQQTTADLYIRHVSNGLFTGLLFNGTVKEGNILKAEAPFGTFTFNTPKDKKAVFLVTGTGIAPVMSILRTLKTNDDLKGRGISLFWGVRHAKDLAFLSELESLAESYPAFKFYPVVSKDENWPGLKGRITKHAAEIIGDFTDCDTYLCGSTPMVNSVTDYLFVRCGLKEDRTFSDAFGG